MNARKSIFITGATSKIGMATARRFAGEGWFEGTPEAKAGRVPGSSAV